MIRFIDESFKRDIELENLCMNDPFGVRILSIYKTYDRALDFIDLWYQEDQRGGIIAVISRFQDSYTLFAKHNISVDDKLELKEFINFRSPSSLLCDPALKLNFDSALRTLKGDVLKFRISHASFKDIRDDLYEKPGTVCYYSILKQNESEDFKVPDYMHFLSDITYRKNRNRISLFGIKNGTSVVSVCMTVSECDNAVIIGAVATAPAYQRQGYLSKLLNRAASLLSLDNRDVYILSADDRNTKLYKKIGFARKCSFTEYYFR